MNPICIFNFQRCFCLSQNDNFHQFFLLNQLENKVIHQVNHLRYLDFIKIIKYDQEGFPVVGLFTKPRYHIVWFRILIYIVF